MQLQTIQNKIYEIRGQNVMLDSDLAELFGVETKRLNEAVKRNLERFPERFMFKLTPEEWKCMRSQIATASGQYKRNVEATPFAFTEHGVTMLASVLRSPQAIKMNIAIVEAFISLKELASSHKEIMGRLKELESQYDQQFRDVYEALNFLLQKDEPDQSAKSKTIGF